MLSGEHLLRLPVLTQGSGKKFPSKAEFLTNILRRRGGRCTRACGARHPGAAGFPRGAVHLLPALIRREITGAGTPRKPGGPPPGGRGRFCSRRGPLPRGMRPPLSSSQSPLSSVSACGENCARSLAPPLPTARGAAGPLSVLPQKRTRRARCKRKRRFWLRSGAFAPLRYMGVGVRGCLRVFDRRPTGAAE